jgi:hypothetical protein
MWPAHTHGTASSGADCATTIERVTLAIGACGRAVRRDGAATRGASGGRRRPYLDMVRRLSREHHGVLSWLGRGPLGRVDAIAECW